MSRFLLPDGEIAEEVTRRLPTLTFTGFAAAGAMEDLSAIEFYVPPYLGGPETVEMLDRLPNVRVVQLLTAGVDWISDRVPPGVTLCNARGVHEVSTSELVLAGVLAMAKSIPTFVRQQEQAVWHHRRVGALYGKRAVIVGYGAVGRAVGDRLAAFGVDVRGVTRTGRDGTTAIPALPSVLRDCELLVITLPLTEETTGLVDAHVLRQLPDGAIVVNVARGPIVDAAALESELSSGWLAAVLDVTVPELLPPDSPLWAMDNVLITPHVGGNTVLFPQLGGALVADQISRYLDGRPLLHQVSGDY